MKTDIFYHLKAIITLKYEIALQELDLKFKQSCYDDNKDTYSELQKRIQHLNIHKQSIIVEIQKLDLELYKMTHKIDEADFN